MHKKLLKASLSDLNGRPGLHYVVLHDRGNDDVVGFTRGFLYAGTSSIVSSLWKVDDQATSELMQEFYRELGKTDKRTALKNAQRYVREKINEHPYYWAAFQLTGSI